MFLATQVILICGALIKTNPRVIIWRPI